MNGIKLDLRKMPHFERHSKIFEDWNSLKSGQILRIINDHDPKPLYYQFDAEMKGSFEWNYEKQGPKDWIVKIKKTQDSKRQQVKELLKELHSGKNAKKIKEKGKKLLKGLSPAELGLIEQEIIQEGVSRKDMRKLCDVHLEIMKESLEGKALNLKPGHLLHTLMEEHKMILDFVEKMKKAVKKLEKAKGFEQAGKEIEILKHVSEHLVEADKHHQREEEVLFPEMEKAGINEPPEIMREEHEELKARKKALFNLAINGKKIKFKEFVKKVKKNADYIAKELPDHIYKEDNILYPMAMQAIQAKNWARMKNACDKIGYCCFTPSF
ncbi:MAG: DUF438 domain-containing protein [Candidatus Diapherotrites archaeon]|nr:DUF438 domain-containing protein [Candidatus Diapherotrites archaeon]